MWYSGRLPKEASMRFGKWWFIVLAAGATACTAPSTESDDVEGGEEIGATEDGFHTVSGTRVSAYAFGGLEGGARTTLELRVRDSSGRPITSFEDDHTKKLHLVIVSHDLSYFTHVHPSYVGAGKFRIDWTPPAFDDQYALYVQYKPSGAPELITTSFKAHVPALTMKFPVPVTEETAPVTSGKSKLTFQAPPNGIAVGASTVKFKVTNTSTGQPADLGTFLGARAHVIAVKAESQASVFLHGHDMRSMGHAGHAGGGALPAPGELAFDLKFPEAGLYRLWVQYNQGGKDITQYVTVNVGASANACNYNDPNRGYVAQTAQECALVMAACISGRTWFNDACGCGCEVQ